MTPANHGFLGVLMLRTRFPRPPGDIGNAATFAFPTRCRVVPGADAQTVVRERARDLLQPFVDAGMQLCAEGARAITTSCGFLALFQRELAAALPVPVATSSLLQAAWLAPLLPNGRRVGIVTVDAASLGADHLRAVGVATDTPVEGLDADDSFARTLLGDEPALDAESARREVCAAARRLVLRHPDVAAIVLECTNMPPYARAVAEAVQRPVYDVVTLANWLWCGLSPRRFSAGS